MNNEQQPSDFPTYLLGLVSQRQFNGQRARLHDVVLFWYHGWKAARVSSIDPETDQIKIYVDFNGDDFAMKAEFWPDLQEAPPTEANYWTWLPDKDF